MNTCSLSDKKCLPCEGDVPALNLAMAEALLKQLSEGWQLSNQGTAICKTFTFKGYWPVIGFVNAIAWMAQQEGHHPDLSVHFGKVIVTYTTHAASGLTENDFICAAKIDQLQA